MKLYEICEQLENCIKLEDGSAIDGNTGELIDIAAIEELEMARDEKVENIALWIKNLVSDADQIKEEREKLQEREKSARAKADSLKDYLGNILAGQKFNTPRVAISFTPSERVQVDDESKVPELYIKTKTETSVDKTGLKKALKSGLELEGVRIISKQNIQIK